jgi:hypothetical protein
MEVFIYALSRFLCSDDFVRERFLCSPFSCPIIFSHFLLPNCLLSFRRFLTLLTFVSDACLLSFSPFRRCYLDWNWELQVPFLLTGGRDARSQGYATERGSHDEEVWLLMRHNLFPEINMKLFTGDTLIHRSSAACRSRFRPTYYTCYVLLRSAQRSMQHP